MCEVLNKKIAPRSLCIFQQWFFFSAFSMPGTVLDSGNIAVDKTISLLSSSLYVVGEKMSKWTYTTTKKNTTKLTLVVWISKYPYAYFRLGSQAESNI